MPRQLIFGIIYGMSSFGLSQDLSITPKEAKHILTNICDISIN